MMLMKVGLSMLILSAEASYQGNAPMQSQKLEPCSGEKKTNCFCGLDEYQCPAGMECNNDICELPLCSDKWADQRADQHTMQIDSGSGKKNICDKVIDGRRCLTGRCDGEANKKNCCASKCSGETKTNCLCGSDQCPAGEKCDNAEKPQCVKFEQCNGETKTNCWCGSVQCHAGKECNNDAANFQCMVALKTEDRKTVMVDEDTLQKLAKQSKLIGGMMEEEWDPAFNEKIPLYSVTKDALDRVIEYCKHVDENGPPPKIEKPLKTNELSNVVNDWYAKFVDMEKKPLFELILAANWLNIPSLLELACAKVASLIKGMSIQEIRVYFDIENDFTPEEEAKIKDENRWADESF